MEGLHYKITLAASPEKVWQVLWNNDSYSTWTAPFAEGSRMQSDFKVGGKTFFLDGNGSGMVSTIVAIEPNKYIFFKHLGEVKEGKEEYDSPQVKEWAGATENYTLKAIDGGTELTVELYGMDAMKSYFEPIWPKVLDIIKELAEKA